MVAEEDMEAVSTVEGAAVTVLLEEPTAVAFGVEAGATRHTEESLPSTQGMETSTKISGSQKRMDHWIRRSHGVYIAWLAGSCAAMG